MGRAASLSVSSSGAGARYRRTPSGLIFTRRVEYGPFPSQRRFHGLKSRYKGFSGAIGSGKSRALCQEALRLAHVNARCLGLLGAPTYKILADVTRLTFLEILAENSIPHTFFKSENRIHLKEPGSDVIFRSLEEPEHLRGSNLAWFGVDELTYCQETGWRRLEGRLRDPRAKERCGFGAWTPRGFNWTYKLFISEDRPRGYECILAKAFENRAILDQFPDFYEQLRHSYDELFYRQEVLGEYLDIYSGRVYFAFTDENVEEEPRFNPAEPVCWALDFNVDPMTSVIAQRYKDTLHVLQELYLRNSNTEKMCEAFYDRIQPYRQRIPSGEKLRVRIYGDASMTQRHTSATKTDYELIRQFFRLKELELDADFQTEKSNPSVADRIKNLNGLLCNVDGKRRLFTAKACKELITDFLEVTWKEGSSTELEKKKDSKRTHISDALGYLVYRDFRVNGFRSQILRPDGTYRDQ